MAEEIIAQESPENVENVMSVESVESVLKDPIYKHKDGRIFTKQELINSGVDENRINSGIQKGLMSQIGDTDDPNQRFQHKDGRIFTVSEFKAEGVNKDRIADGISKGLLVPLEKKNQIPSEISSKGSQVGVSPSTTPIPRSKELQGILDAIDTKNFLKPNPVDASYVAKPLTGEKIEQAERGRANMKLAIDNTTERALKAKGITTAKNSPTYIKQRKKIEEAVKNGDAALTVDPTTKGPLVKLRESLNLLPTHSNLL